MQKIICVLEPSHPWCGTWNIWNHARCFGGASQRQIPQSPQIWAIFWDTKSWVGSKFLTKSQVFDGFRSQNRSLQVDACLDFVRLESGGPSPNGGVDIQRRSEWQCASTFPMPRAPADQSWMERNSDQWHAFRLLFSAIFGGYNSYYELLLTVINYYLTHSYQAADLKPKPDSCSTTLLWHLRFAVNLSSVGQRVAMLKLASGVGTAWNSRKDLETRSMSWEKFISLSVNGLPCI